MSQLGLQDFLAVSPEYNQRKELVEKSLKRRLIIFTPLLLILFVLGMVLMITYNFIVGGAVIVVSFITISFVAMGGEARKKSDLEKFGNFLYSQYINSQRDS